MVYNRFKGFRNFYYVALAAILVVLFWAHLGLANALFHPNGVGGDYYAHYLLYQIAAVIGLLFASLKAGQMNGDITRCDLIGSHNIAFRNVVFIAGAVLLVEVLLKDAMISRLFLFTLLPLLYLAFFVTHRLLPKVLLRTLFSDRQQRRVLLVGPPAKAQEMKLWCQQTAELGLDIANFGETPDYFRGIASLPDPDELERLERTIRRGKIQQIILLELPFDRRDLEEIVKLSDRLGIRLLVVNNLPELFKHPISHFNLYGIEFIGIRDEPLEEPINRLIKRAFDLAISIPIVVIVLPPLMILVDHTAPVAVTGTFILSANSSGILQTTVSGFLNSGRCIPRSGPANKRPRTILGFSKQGAGCGALVWTSFPNSSTCCAER